MGIKPINGGEFFFVSKETEGEGIKPFLNTGFVQTSYKKIQQADDKVGVEVDGYSTNKNNKSSTDMPESIPTPPKNGVSKKSLDGATYYEKEYIEGSEEPKFPPMFDMNGNYIGGTTEPMYRETIEYDDGTVITNIYEGDKLVKSIEDKYSGDPSKPQHGDTRDTKTFYYKDDGSVEVVVKNENEYIEDIGWADHLVSTLGKYTFYDEDGNEVSQYMKDSKTGGIIENPEYEEFLRDFSIGIPDYSSETQKEDRRRRYSRDESRY